MRTPNGAVAVRVMSESAARSERPLVEERLSAHRNKKRGRAVAPRYDSTRVLAILCARHIDAQSHARGRHAFDETLPVADGLLEAGFQVSLDALRADLEDWLTRKFGHGHAVKLSLIPES